MLEEVLAAILYRWPLTFPPLSTREAAIQFGLNRFMGEQWAFWPLGAEVEKKLRHLLESRFEELFVQGPQGFMPGWVDLGNEVLISWQP